MHGHRCSPVRRCMKSQHTRISREGMGSSELDEIRSLNACGCYSELTKLHGPLRSDCRVSRDEAGLPEGGLSFWCIILRKTRQGACGPASHIPRPGRRPECP